MPLTVEPLIMEALVVPLFIIEAPVVPLVKGPLIVDELVVPLIITGAPMCHSPENLSA